MAAEGKGAVEMARIRLAGVLLVAAVSLGAVTAGSASAEIPELGRCVKVEGVQEGKKTVYHGKYANKNCIKQKVISNGKYEFLPGPGPKSEYYGVALDPSPELVTVSGRKISCSVIAFKGNYTGPKTETVKISLGGCEEGSRPCQTNPASVGEIEGLSALEGELGTISKGTNKLNVGWDLKHEGVIFTFTCGKFPEIGGLEALEGPSVIGVVAGGFFSNLDKMSIYSTIKYNETGGKQIPEAFEGGLKDTLLLKSITGNTSEQVALKGVEETTSGKGEPIEKEENQEQLEVKAKGN
jgi:hypothetical protein